MSHTNMLAGRVWKFGDNVNTDLMLPGPYLVQSAEAQAKAVFINNSTSLRSLAPSGSE